MDHERTIYLLLKKTSGLVTKSQLSQKVAQKLQQESNEQVKDASFPVVEHADF
jgi:hypothetical protein